VIRVYDEAGNVTDMHEHPSEVQGVVSALVPTVLLDSVSQMPNNSARFPFMALVECPECKHTISDRALACPACGFPLAASVSLPARPAPTQDDDQPAVAEPPLKSRISASSPSTAGKKPKWIWHYERIADGTKFAVEREASRKSTITQQKKRR